MLNNRMHMNILTTIALTGPLFAAVYEESFAQTIVVLEDFEFAVSDAAADAGVVDLTDAAHRPTFYISGGGDDASPNEPGGLFSIGTSAVFCLNASVPCDAGTFVGFRRYVDPDRFPDQCAGQNVHVLQYSYADPSHPGPAPADYDLSELAAVWDAYGEGGFADGALGTHLWLRLVDCEGEKFEFVNFSEAALYSDVWTFDLQQGSSFLRIAPESLVDVPNGDRLLTEIVAIEALVQDPDDPPTTIGDWYVDYLRIIEPTARVFGDADGDGDVDDADWTELADCVAGPSNVYPLACEVFDGDADGDVDLSDCAAFMRVFLSTP